MLKIYKCNGASKIFSSKKFKFNRYVDPGEISSAQSNILSSFSIISLHL
jgi:hypothetical protein